MSHLVYEANEVHYVQDKLVEMFPKHKIAIFNLFRKMHLKYFLEDDCLLYEDLFDEENV